MPYIDMNHPWVYMCSPPLTPLPSPSPSHPSGSSRCTSPEHPISCIEIPISFMKAGSLPVSVHWLTSGRQATDKYSITWLFKLFLLTNKYLFNLKPAYSQNPKETQLHLHDVWTHLFCFLVHVSIINKWGVLNLQRVTMWGLKSFTRNYILVLTVSLSSCYFYYLNLNGETEDPGGLNIYPLDFSDDPVSMTLNSQRPKLGAWVRSLVRKLESTWPN